MRLARIRTSGLCIKKMTNEERSVCMAWLRQVFPEGFHEQHIIDTDEFILESMRYYEKGRRA